MKILILAEQLDPSSGWGRYTRDLVLYLTKAGAEVVVVCEKNSPDVAVKQYACLKSPLQFKKNYFLASVYARTIAFQLRKSNFSPDIIHCCVEPYAAIAQKISRKLLAPYVITTHGSFGIRPLTIPFVGYIHKQAYKHAQKIICVSTYTEKRILSEIPASQTIVINNSLNTDVFNQDAYRNKENILLSVGALKERKGYEYILKAIPFVLKHVPDLRYNIVGNMGDKKYVAKLNKIIEENNLEKNIFFYEHISDSELQKLYSGAKVFALTPISSRDSFEGFGLVYLEANRYGIPVVGSYDNGGEDAIQHGKTGILTEPKNSEDIGRALVDLLTLSSSEYQKMFYNAQNWAKNMTWEQHISKYIKVYEEVQSRARLQR